MVKIFVFSLSFLSKVTNGESFVFLGHFWPTIPIVKVLVDLGHFWPRYQWRNFCLVIFGQGYQRWKFLFFMDIFGQGYFYWPLRLWIPMTKVIFEIWDFERPLASRSAKREFAFAGGNLWDPTVQAGIRTPGGNCWHGIASTSILVHR